MTETAAPPPPIRPDEPAVEPIAVVGLACRLPGARDAGEYWHNLVHGVESITMTTLEEQAARGVPAGMLADPNFVPAAAILDDYEWFDAAFFGMSAREAELRDPQHRLLLELSYSALEDAGYDPARYPGEIGVYAGCGDSSYEWHNVRRNRKVFATAGVLSTAINTHPDFMATFVSYKLNLRGPSLTVHTACSTSLVTLHLACEALRAGECDMALSGAASIDLPPGWGYTYVEDGIYSPDGHIRAFDAGASGTIWGNGGGMVVLKRLSDAVADGDTIRAVVLGNAINNDGTAKVGFTAPSQEGQSAVIAQALGVAGIDPRTISYVEAHGTGTGLGDPIEVAGLSSAYQRDTTETGWCAIGSVKTNIGHLGPAAGIASVIKAALALEHGMIPASLHFERPNPKIEIERSPFYVNATLSPWQPDGLPRRAGVSSFGMGGTNAHVIMEEPPAIEPEPPGDRPAHLVLLSARTETALAASARTLGTHLSAAAEDMTDVAYTLRVGRRELEHRLAVVAADPADAAAALADAKRRITGRTGNPPRVALMFSGQGAQYAGMGAGLYETEPVYRAAVDECTAILAADGVGAVDGVDVATALAATGTAADEALARTEVTQPALFTVGYALARLWQSWGVQPAAMVGHSIGEYVAATVAGVFDLADALHVVAARGRLMQSMPAGSMLAVQLDETELAPRLPADVSVATVNGPGACVAAGPPAAIEALAATLAADRIGARALRTSHAFHSPMMEPILAEFRSVVASVPLHAPRLPFLSDVSGDWITPAEATDPSYWARHLREPVRFGDCLATLLAEGAWLLVECGPGRQLAGLVRLHRGGSGTALPSLPHRGDKKTDLEVLYAAAGRMWTAGVPMTAEAFGPAGRRVPLPGYAWERKYFWVKPDADGAAGYDESDAVRPARRALDDWFAVPTWQQLPPATDRAPLGRTLLFSDAPADSAGDLLPAGTEVVRVAAGAGYDRDDDGGYLVRPAVRADYDALLADLADAGWAPDRIVHAWTLTDPAAETSAIDAAETSAIDTVDNGPERTWAAQDRGFFSLLALVQALAAAPPDGEVHLDVLTRGTQDVTGTDLLRPEHATVGGIAAVVPLELTWLTVRHIDLDPAGPVDRARLAAELAAPAGDPVALRGGRRWQRRFEDVTVAAEPAERRPVELRERGVYLITGGLGGIGITVAEDLAATLAARLVLVSRSGLPPRADWDTTLAVHGTAERTGRAIAAIRRMEAAGAEVLVLAADVSDPAAMRAVRAATIEAYGRVDGIVHAAGVPGGGMVEVKERAAVEQVMRPKIAGTLALQAAFADLPVDFVLLCSSVYAVAGEFGQVDYCAANHFMDAYARAGRGWRAPVVSVNWGSWLEVGMSAEVAAPAAFRALQRGDRITPVDHDLLTRRHAGDETSPGWCGGLVSAGTHWILDHHRIGGVPVIPGTGHLEAARQAFEQVSPRPAPGHLVELRDVAFIEPMSVPDGASAELQVVFSPGLDGLDFQVVSLTGGTQRTHAQGTACWVAGGEAPVVDLAELRERCSLVTQTVENIALSSTGLITFGAHWGNLRTIHGGQDEELALLEATEETASDLHRWVLHPALLDEATAYGRSGFDERFLPLGYGKVTVRGPLPARLWSWLRHRDGGGSEVRASDISLLDDAGREVVSISQFTTRHVDGAALTANMAAALPAHEGGPAGAVAGGGESLAGADAAGGIRPAEGAECVRRLVLAELGPQVIVSVTPINDIIASTREFTQDTIEGDLDAGAFSATGGGWDDSDGRVAPRTELEAAIARIWAEVLGGRIGVTDDFFEAGGNSLIAVQLIALVRKEIGVRLPMRAIFEVPTVAAIAGLIEKLRAESNGAAAPEPAGTGNGNGNGHHHNSAIPVLARPALTTNA
jgi:phthiocerol/phenolphthiocerol synthesis type-I polyketide synthase E